MGNNNGPVGKRHKRAYYELQRAGVSNALAKGMLFGRPVEKVTKRVIMHDRGKVIWPDPPKGLMRHWWRAQQTGHWPEVKQALDRAALQRADTSTKRWLSGLPEAIDALPVSG